MQTSRKTTRRTGKTRTDQTKNTGKDRQLEAEEDEKEKK